MNYEKIYEQLIERSIFRTLEGYAEMHHIVPQCFGGTNEKSNLTPLTAREHFIAHLLLYRIQTSKRRRHQMLKACTMMAGKEIYNSRLYEGARKEYSAHQSERMCGENHPMYGTCRSGEDNPFYGKNHTQETKDIISEQRTGMVVALNLITGEKYSVSKAEFDSNPNLVGHTTGYIPANETRYKYGNSSRGKIYVTDDIVEKRIFESDLIEHPTFHKGRLLYECLYCFKKTDIINLKKYHNEKCKNKIEKEINDNN